MDALPYYKWYWIDYRANRKVQRMGWQARGLYRELLDEFWSEGFIPNDTVQLAEICGCDHTSFILHWPQILVCWEETPDGLVNSKMDEQRTITDSRRAANARSGSAGARIKLANAKQTLANATPVTESKEVSGERQANASERHIAEQSRAEHIKKAEQSMSRESRSIATAALLPPEKLAREIQQRTGLLTEGCLRVLTSVVRREQNSGIPSEVIVPTLSDVWADYQRVGPELAVTFGAEKFFGEGKWKDRESWGWRNNGTTKTGQSLDAAREAIRRIEVEADRRAAGDFGDSQAGEAGAGGLPSLRG